MNSLKYFILFIIIALSFFTASCDNDNNIVDPRDNRIYSIDNYLNSEKINTLISEIGKGTYGDVNSLLIMRDDSLIVEEYFRDFSRNDLHVCYSVTKSFTSALIGIAKDKNLIENTDTKLSEYFPHYNFTDNLKKQITLDNVLTMSAGLEWDEWEVDYYDSNNLLQQLGSSSDWISFVLNRNMETTPGEVFKYNSGLTVLLSGVILSATGQRTSDFARQNLFNHLDINYFSWQEAPNNITNTGWGLSMRPLDLLKFGRLFLNNGKYNNQQIISEAWVNTSTADHIKLMIIIITDINGGDFRTVQLPEKYYKLMMCFMPMVTAINTFS